MSGAPEDGFVRREAADLAPSAELDEARAQIRAARLTPAAGAMRDRTLDFLHEHSDALHRTCAPGHLTGSALVLNADRSRALLLFHTKLERWLQPGGHADGDANLARVAQREAAEETGIDGLVVLTPAIDLDIHRVAPPGEPPHLHYDLRYLVLAPADAVEVGNHESTALAWVAEDELESHGADASLLRLARVGFAL